MIEQMLIGYKIKKMTDEQMNGETDWRIDGQTVILNNSTALLQKNINLERQTWGI